MKEVTHKEVCEHQGGKIVGPIPDGVNPVEFVCSKQARWPSEANPDRYCIHLYKKVRVYKPGEAMYTRVQGCYWLLY